MAQVAASKKSIEDFKANLANGGVRPTMFEASITFPEMVYEDLTLTNQKFTFLCKAATLPGSNIGFIDVPFRGRKLKVSGDRTFNDWSVTIINDTDQMLRKAMEKWSEIIQNHNFALGHNTLGKSVQDGAISDGYFGTGMVRQLNRQGEQLRYYEFAGIWPQQISDIALDFGVNDTIEEYDVNFCVQYWHAGGRNVDGGDLGATSSGDDDVWVDPASNKNRVIS